MSESVKVVILSYATQDTGAAMRIAEAPRLSGVEVWLNQKGVLVGDDAWDRKIREQITSTTTGSGRNLQQGRQIRRREILHDSA
jgi:hypothetical protein